MNIVLNKPVEISVQAETFPKLFQRESIEAKQVKLVLLVLVTSLTGFVPVYIGSICNRISILCHYNSGIITIIINILIPILIPIPSLSWCYIMLYRKKILSCVKVSNLLDSKTQYIGLLGTWMYGISAWYDYTH